MKKKYTKAKVEIIPLKTEAGICAGTDTQGTAGGQEAGEVIKTDPNEKDDFEGGGAKAYDFDGVTDFPSDPIPPTKE